MIRRRERLDLLLMLPSRDTGGAEHYAMVVARHAHQAGWRVGVAIPHTEGTAPFIRQLRAEGLGVLTFRGAVEVRGSRGQARRDLVEMFSALAMLARWRPSRALLVLPRQELMLGAQLACAAAGVPQTIVFQLAARPVPQPRRKLRLYALIRRRGAQLVAVSKQNARALAETFDCSVGEIAVVYNGSDFSPSSRKVASRPARELAERSQGGALLLGVGRLTHQKGCDLLIQALPLILRNHPDTLCAWAGEGESADGLRQMVSAYGLEDRFLFLGRRADVRELMSACQIFVFPSREEGHPFALLEAMGVGAAVVSSDAAGIPEIVQRGVHGVLHRSEDACDLMDKLVWALDHPHEMQRMAVSASARARDFSQERMLTETFALLERSSRSEAA